MSLKNRVRSGLDAEALREGNLIIDGNATSFNDFNTVSWKQINMGIMETTSKVFSESYEAVEKNMAPKIEEVRKSLVSISFR